MLYSARFSQFLPLSRALVVPTGGFSHSTLTSPQDGLYFLSLTISVSKDHYVTVALRQNTQTLLLLTVCSISRSFRGRAVMLRNVVVLSLPAVCVYAVCRYFRFECAPKAEP